MRPISNVVDVTNYVLLERNQPLHAFDLARLAGRGIVVRLADDGETMTTLDGVERALTHEDLLICDAERAPQAIAGIMGGSTSEVSDATTEILLESAYFEPMGIARIVEAAEAAQRVERAVRARHRPRRRSRATPNGRWSSSSRWRGRRSRPTRATCTRHRSNAAAHPRAHEPGERGARHRPRRRGRVGRRWRRSASSSTPTRPTAPTATHGGDGPDLPARPRPRDRPGRGGRSPHRLRPHRADPARHPRSGRHAHRPPAGAPAGRRRARRRRPLRGDHALAGLAGRPRARRRAARSASCAPPTRCGRRSRCCAPRCSPGCCARWPATARTASPTSRCSRWAGCSSPRSAPRRRRSAARRARARRAGVGGHRGPPPGRGRPPGRRVRRGRCRHRGRRRAGVHDVDAGAREPARLPRRPGGPGGGRRPRRRHRRRGRAGGARTRSGSTARWSTAELVLDTLLDARPPRPHVPRAVALPGVDRRPRVRARRRVSPPPTSCARSAAAVGDVLEDVRRSTSSVRRRSAPAGGASRSRCASVRPTARSPTPRSARCASAPSTRSSTAHGAELRG